MQGKKHGYGVLHSENGQQYEGYSFPMLINNRLPIGHWKSDDHHGYGILKLSDGTVIEGLIALPSEQLTTYRRFLRGCSHKSELYHQIPERRFLLRYFWVCFFILNNSQAR